MSDEWVGDDLDPPDWERSIVSSPEAIANALGLRPQDFDAAAPLGSQAEGRPIAQPNFRPTPEKQPERRETVPDPATRVADLAAEVRQHGKRTIARAVAAERSGDPAKVAAAVADMGEAVKLGDRLRRKLRGAR